MFAARAALRGRKWGAVLLAVLSGYGVVTGLSSLAISSFNRVIARVVPDGYSYSLPDWLLVVAGVFAAVDLLVVVLLLLPPSRAWIRELNPPRTATAPQPPMSWPPPTGPFDRRH